MPAQPYTHVRVVAHTPFTGIGSGHASAEKNIENFKKALALAVAEIKKLKDGDEVLPVFVAAEGTWKKNPGAYNVDEVGQIYTFLTATSKANPDILFFPGTILWRLAKELSADALKKPAVLGETRIVPSNLASKKGHSVVYNSVPVFFGGKLIHNLNQQFEDVQNKGDDRFDFALGPDKGREFWKNFKWGEGTDVDWVGNPKQGNQIFLNGELVQGTAKKSVNIRFGLETGLDASYKTLANLKKVVDVQILLAGGVPFEKEGFATDTYGLAIHCEGNTQDWKKNGLKVFTVDDEKFVPPATPIHQLTFGDDKTAIVVDKRRMPLHRLFLKADPKVRPAAMRAKDYEEFRRQVALVKQDELKEVFAENIERRKEWIKVAKDKAEDSMIIQTLKAGTWDSPGWKKWRGNVETGTFLNDGFNVFCGSALGVGLGFFIGVNQHLDAMFQSLGALDDELFLLGNYLTDKNENPHLCWIQGPLKKIKDAMDKTLFRPENYSGNAWENKDLVRGTVVACSDDPKANKELVEKVAGTIIPKICSAEFGMNILTPANKREAKPKAGDPTCCGYSGWNIKILFAGHPKLSYKEEDDEEDLDVVGKGWAKGVTAPQDPKPGPIPAEIQINTREMMFSKHSMRLLRDKLVFDTDAEYFAHEKRAGFQGGLGHVLYEIARSEDKSADGLAAAALARDYHDMARKVPQGSEPAKLEKLAKDLEEFGAKLTNAKWKKAWTEHFDDKWSKGKTLSGGAVARTKTW